MSGLWIAFDADDTLWHNEAYFIESYDLFAEIVGPYLEADDTVAAAHDLLIATETANIPSFGYGIKGATISMIEAAITASRGELPADQVMALVDRAKTMMAHPVDLIDGAIETLDALSHHRLALVTKGDLKDQHRKIDESGLAERFDSVEIVHEKDVASYGAIMARLDSRADDFVMIGNSIRSDVLPVLEMGAWAVHVPYTSTWAIEAAEEPTDHPRFRRAEALSESVAIVEELAGGGPTQRVP